MLLTCKVSRNEVWKQNFIYVTFSGWSVFQMERELKKIQKTNINQSWWVIPVSGGCGCLGERRLGVPGQSGSSGSCRLFPHFLKKIAVQKMSGKTPGSPRHPSSRHPRSSDSGRGTRAKYTAIGPLVAHSTPNRESQIGTILIADSLSVTPLLWPLSRYTVSAQNLAANSHNFNQKNPRAHKKNRHSPPLPNPK